MLPKTYRLRLENETGQTLPSGDAVVTSNRWRYASGTPSFDSERTEYSLTSNLSDGSSDAGATRDNSSEAADGGLWVGGWFVFEVDAPASVSGYYAWYLEVSTDGGSTWDDALSGVPVVRVDVSSSGLVRRSRRLPV